ncbi:hypothetical protein ACHAWO_011311 [Cyclotella atomus]|uniref:DDE Tnp4 domain-containing protein n=1 Tax=Cyclotella atomus TaxID=382360 RepID=A0ABD3N110_9STRA
MSYDAHRSCVLVFCAMTSQRKRYNSRSFGPIAVEHIVAAGLRTLQGGRVKDARHIIPVHPGLRRTYALMTSLAVVLESTRRLEEIKLPQNDSEWRAVNEDFAQRSTHRAMSGCVGSKEVTNIISYYNGHYESYGVNNLALVKADLQFMYFVVVSPGSTNDFSSYHRANGLKECADSLPLGLYFVADAAFPLSEHVLILV